MNAVLNALPNNTSCLSVVVKVYDEEARFCTKAVILINERKVRSNHLGLVYPWLIDFGISLNPSLRLSHFNAARTGFEASNNLEKKNHGMQSKRHTQGNHYKTSFISCLLG